MKQLQQLASPEEIDNKMDSHHPRLPFLQQWLIGIGRIAFGISWAVAAWLKWQPAFIQSFMNTVGGATNGQPAIIKLWIGTWAGIVHVNPIFFAIAAASTETALALCFLLGAFTNTASVVGLCWSLIIWSAPEGFGGPYIMGQSTDIGTAFPYAIICLLLLAVSSGRYLGLDTTLTARLGRWSFLATGSR